MDKKLLSTLLKNQPLIKGLTEKNLSDLYEKFEIQVFSPNQIIIKEGEETVDLYIITTGLVNVIKWDEQHINQILISKLEVGESFGELAFLDNSPRSTTIKATKTTEVLKLSRDKLLDEKNKEVLDKILLNISLINSKRLQSINNLYVKNLEINKEATENRFNFGRILLYGYMILFLSVAIYSLTNNLRFYSIPWVMALIPIIFLINHYGVKWRHFGFNLLNWRSTLTNSIFVTIVSLGLSYLLYHWIFVHFHRTTLFGQNVFLKDTLITDFNFKRAMVYGFLALIVECVSRGILQSSLQNFLQDRSGYKTIFLNAAFLFTALVPLGLGFAFNFFLLSLPMGYFFLQQQSLLGVCLIHFLLCFVGVLNF